MYAQHFTAVIIINNANFKPFDVGSLFHCQLIYITQTPKAFKLDSTHNYVSLIGLVTPLTF